eukprot:CAMPEP_0116015154 /NCGR_PEP_ID=MMETSP0321-20121206/6673_1 /TAXON_ID=163516 /ORGANISM="Leptocylindrus danicus var. danicus, Strain B650" /LENGTH=458 /DNA_ID=CAMNT_0003484881 /DNA_START=93 /DNA_END=1469 /DNA_ORIENTATION=+
MQAHFQPEKIHSCNLNQDNTCLSLATTHGYRIYSVNTTNNNNSQNNNNAVDLIHSSLISADTYDVDGRGKGGVQIAKMLYCTSLLAIVYTNNPRLLSIEDASGNTATSSSSTTSARSPNGNTIRCERAFGSRILRVELNRRRLVVLTSDGLLHVFDLSSKSLCVSLNAIPSGSNDYPAAMNDLMPLSNSFALSNVETAQYNWLVCRNAENAGAIQVYNTIGVRMENVAKVHVSEIQAMTIGGGKSEVLATASTKGTVIRVWSLPDCRALYSFRRGRNPCTIYSLAFNISTSRLAVSSNSGTIHLFALSASSSSTDSGSSFEDGTTTGLEAEEAYPELSPSYSQTTRKKAIKNPLFSQCRSYAKIRLKPEATSNVLSNSNSSIPPNMLALRSSQSNTAIEYVVVASSSGIVQTYRVNYSDDKSCTCAKIDVVGADDLLGLVDDRNEIKDGKMLRTRMSI